MFGVGVGYLTPEFEALGIPMEDRGPRSVEYIEAMRSIWHDDEPSYNGKYVSFDGVKANPRPVNPLGPPVIMGGHSKPAWRRTVTHCQGWYGFMLDPENTAKNIAGIKELQERHERPEALGEIETTVTPLMRPGPEMLETYGEMGVDRLVLLAPVQTVDDSLAFIDQIHDGMLG
ncbi:MAG: Alkanesulfonate monooxygenase [Acidimicrobiales bacterium AG-410-I20]|nr:MAG: Alkanesulfonate monooxygenase [Acidimicrobiales bacterium AG-410-I20]